MFGVHVVAGERAEERSCAAMQCALHQAGNPQVLRCTCCSRQAWETLSRLLSVYEDRQYTRLGLRWCNFNSLTKSNACARKQRQMQGGQTVWEWFQHSIAPTGQLLAACPIRLIPQELCRSILNAVSPLLNVYHNVDANASSAAAAAAAAAVLLPRTAICAAGTVPQDATNAQTIAATVQCIGISSSSGWGRIPVANSGSSSHSSSSAAAARVPAGSVCRAGVSAVRGCCKGAHQPGVATPTQCGQAGEEGQTFGGGGEQTESILGTRGADSLLMLCGRSHISVQ